VKAHPGIQAAEPSEGLATKFFDFPSLNLGTQEGKVLDSKRKARKAQ